MSAVRDKVDRAVAQYGNDARRYRALAALAVVDGPRAMEALLDASFAAWAANKETFDMAMDAALGLEPDDH